MRKYIIPIFILLVLSSCKTRSTAANTTNSSITALSNTAFLNKITEKSDFQQLKINTRISAQTGKFIPPLDAVIYIQKDQKVWINMIAIFLNVGRGIATPDGIKGYEKWNKTYIESDFTYLNNLLNVNFIDYQSFQNLLLGKTFIPVNDKDFKFTKNAEGYNLTSTKNLRFETDGKVTEYSASLDYSPEFDLNKISLQKKGTPDYLEVSYGNRVNFENTKLPEYVKIVIKDSKESQILLENTKFEASKMETPYSVPNNYTKTEIK